MRKTYCIILALLFIGIASSCSFAPLEDFKNPADPGSESYQGYRVVDDPNQIIAETKEDLYLSELRFLVSKVVGAQEYQLQIANDDSFSDIAYENSFASNILEPDASKSHLRRYWRVRAKVADVWGNWGSIKSFIYLHSQTLYFDSQGGSTPEAYKEVSEGSSYGILTTPSRNGYSFEGWWSEPDGAGIQITSETTVATNSGHVVYAKWIPQYTVTFDSQGGFDPSPTSKVVTSGQTYGALATVTRNDYVFDGWWTGISGAGEEILSTTQVTLSSNQTLYAKWIPQYTVTFDSQGGFDPSPTSKVVTSGQTYGALATVTRNDYVFDGWWTGVEGTGTQIFSSSTVNLTSNTTLYANWYRAYQVGELGPAGGYIFYDKRTYSDGWRYMEAASDEFEQYLEWKDVDIFSLLGETSTAIGTGKNNTEMIVEYLGESDYAAKYCYDLVVSNKGTAFDDWFLPCKDELNQMYLALKTNNIGDFQSGWYWSSSKAESAVLASWSQWFYSGVQSTAHRSLQLFVRPVRAF